MRRYLIICAMAVCGTTLFYNGPCSVFGAEAALRETEVLVDKVLVPCRQVELAGTWDIYISVTDEGCPGDFSMKCKKVQIDKAGGIQKSGVVIKNMCGKAIVTGGQLTMSPDCIISGWIETTAGTFYGERGGFLETGKIVIDRVADQKTFQPLNLTRSEADLK